MPIVDPHILAQMPARSHVDRRDGESELFRRASFMPPQRRAVIEGVLKHGLTLREVGEFVGSPAGTISRRFRRYMQILNDPIVVALTEPDCALDADLHALAVAHHLGGKTYTQLAQEHHTSTDAIKQRLAQANGWLQRERAERRKRR
ncbi:MAG: hypothetical protein AAGD32_16640 [Planctomycetota bacterium]